MRSSKGLCRDVTVSRLYIIQAVFIVLLIAMQACTPAREQKMVHAQMYLKVPLDSAGATECFAEGKHYGIMSVREQTFYPNEDSFHKMHHHGVALESEVTAYRIYFDKRQTVDVYAKRTPRLELAESLWYPNDSLLACGYGDDVLKVGNTIGVGSVRPYDREKQRLQNMDKFESRTQRIVALTDTSATVEVEVRGLQTEGKAVDMLTRYTILAGHRDMNCQVYVSDTLGTLVTGVQSIGGGEMMTYEDKGTLLASWGTDWPVNDTIKYKKETLGIAVSVPCRYACEVEKLSGQTLVSLTPRYCNGSEMPTGYRYYAEFSLTTVAMKEDTPPASNAEEFFKYAIKWSEE